jgi:membrane protein YqaA with SNARE-associated domain
MIPEGLTSPAALYLWCFALCLVSAVTPWLVSAEVIVFSLCAFAGGRLNPLAVAVAATAGQMLGKSVMYWAGRGALKFVPVRHQAKITRWRDRFNRHGPASLGIVFVSALAGIPPLYVISILAGSFRMRFINFVAAGSCGRFLRFVSIVYLPHLIPGLVGFVRQNL